MGKRETALREYYGQYLLSVKGLSNSSVRHYYNALNTISQKLKAKELVKEDVYEIKDLDTLNSIRTIIYEDPEFIELNTRGNRMYSCGLDHYCNFASGEEFQGASNIAIQMDITLEAEEPEIIKQTVWKRSNILRVQALTFADHKCELDNSHRSFVAEKTGEQFMEGHHAIPMMLQPQFENSLDVYANLICLCPVCHRKIHFGLREDRVNMLNTIYTFRGDRLANSGIKLSRDEFIELVINN